MDLRELVHAILLGDLIAARQLVADAQREIDRWAHVEHPADLDERELTVAAGVAELLAIRAGEEPPFWTQAVGPAPEMIVLDPGLEEMPRSFARAQVEGPEALRKRNLVALPGFLSVA